MTEAVIIVDVQNDFLPGGALAVPDGDQVIPFIECLVGRDTAVITTQDWHPRASPHFDTWPPHCIMGTPGADLHRRIAALPVFYRVFKGSWLTDGYSGFEDDQLDSMLRSKGVTKLTIVGLALDFCVKATALDAAELGYDTTVFLEGTRPVTPEGGAEAVKELRAAGVAVL